MFCYIIRHDDRVLHDKELCLQQRYSRRLVLLVKATLDNSRAVAKASDSRFRETGFDSFAAVSNTEQVVSLYIAPVYSAV